LRARFGIDAAFAHASAVGAIAIPLRETTARSRTQNKNFHDFQEVGLIVVRSRRCIIQNANGAMDAKIAHCDRRKTK
jgi:hypothetical protein